MRRASAMLKKKQTYIFIVIASMAVATVLYYNVMTIDYDDGLRKTRDFNPAVSNFRANNFVSSSMDGSNNVGIRSESVAIDKHKESAKRNLPSLHSRDAINDKQAIRELLEVKKSHSSTSKKVSAEFEQVLRKVERCLATTHLDADPELKNDAIENAAYFISEFRKVIPNRFLSNYSSHCWEETFNVSLNVPRGAVTGLLGKKTFHKSYTKEVQKESLYDLQRRYRNYFASELMCLPKVFILGFPQCGSTFLWCFLERLLRRVQKFPAHSEKEPHFWMRAPFPTTPIRKPVVSDIADYITNFISGIDQIEKGNKEVVLMDGNPNLIFSSPLFKVDQDRIENNCLLPVLLPHFLPKAKYMVVMRNPIKMLYSTFWYSCTCCHHKVSQATQVKGPHLFHDRIVTKIDIFNDCMRDEDIPAISEPCSLNDLNYGICITKRLHLIDMCVDDITFDLFTPELPRCGKTRIARGLYYICPHTEMAQCGAKRAVLLCDA